MSRLMSNKMKLGMNENEAKMKYYFFYFQASYGSVEQKLKDLKIEATGKNYCFTISNNTIEGAVPIVPKSVSWVALISPQVSVSAGFARLPVLVIERGGRVPNPALMFAEA
jgi:hypothetical protein